MKKLIRKMVPNAVVKYYRGRKFKSKTPQEVFTYIYKNRYWNKDGSSVSGSGSELEATKIVSQKLPEIFRDYNIQSFLDIPCGDFNWMRYVMKDHPHIQYTGADIVEDLIAVNQKQYASDHISFKTINLIQDKLPKVDLILCRDCLVHMSFADVQRSLNNIVGSGSKYLLATTFVEISKNDDIFTGNHRHLNLQKAPFNLPEPLLLIQEKETGFKGHAADKSLGLWKVSDLKQPLQ